MKNQPMTPNVHFTSILPKEAGALSMMALEIWKGYYLPRKILTPGELDCFWQRSCRTEVLQADMESGICHEWIRTGQHTAGFLAYRLEPESARLHLTKLYLRPGYHGQGLGCHSLEHIVSRASQIGARQIYLYVFRKNAQAIRAYQKAGFTVAREEKTWIEEGYCYDDYVMMRAV